MPRRAASRVAAGAHTDAGKRAQTPEGWLRQHQESNNGAFPETIAVTLWGLDTIKTRGESIAIVLALVGARPVKEGTGRTVNFELIPLEELGRPRVDVLAIARTLQRRTLPQNLTKNDP